MIYQIKLKQILLFMLFSSSLFALTAEERAVKRSLYPYTVKVLLITSSMKKVPIDIGLFLTKNEANLYLKKLQKHLKGATIFQEKKNIK